MEPELWNSNFHPISLHGSIDHIASDAKNIKNILNFIARYISNKQVNSSKSNNLENFNSIGEVTWNFISSVYQANWDSLYADKQSNSLKRKIAVKFTLKIQLTSGKNNKDINKPTLANIKRIPLPISAKSQTEVNVISKYFKSNKPANNIKQPSKSYAQALKKTSVCLTSSKSKKLSLPSVQKRLTKSTILSKALLRQSLVSR